MTLWRPSDKPRATFQPIVANEPLTDEERARLAPIRAMYPYLEFTTSQHEMNRLMLERWRWRNGDET